MKLAIVGSRRRNSRFDEEIVQGIILVAYDSDLVVVSGGCKKGADAFAKKMCITAQIPLVEHLPNLEPNLPYTDAVKRYYERNFKIADDCDALVALVADDRKGGTENTIGYATRLKKPVFLVSSEFPEDEAKRLVEFIKDINPIT